MPPCSDKDSFASRKPLKQNRSENQTVEDGPEFGDERVEREFEALKLGAGLDIVPGKEHTGFGCHDGFLREQDLVLQSFCHRHPPHPGQDVPARRKNAGIPPARNDGGLGGRGRQRTPKATQCGLSETGRAPESPRSG